MSKKIVIIGPGSIGSSIAKEVKDDGFEPFLVGRNFSALKKLSEEIGCKFAKADVNNSDELVKALGECGDDVYGLAYCAGSINLKPLSLAHENEYIDSFKVNALGAIIAVKTLIKNIIEQNGSILLFSTVAVKQGFTNHTIVSTAKGAVEALTLSLAAEFSPKVRVNCIAPSLTESEMTKSMLSNQNLKKAIESMHPIPKIGQAEDHAKLASFLLGQSNNWITGQVFHIDGGRSSLRKKD